LGDFIHYGSVEGIRNKLSLFFGRYQTRLLQQVQVMGDAGFGNMEMVSNLSGRPVAILQQLKYLPARFIVQGFKQQVHKGFELRLTVDRPVGQALSLPLNI
jgi:hypothetical protein